MRGRKGTIRLTDAIRRIRVLGTERGPKKIPTWFFYGRTDCLEWDLGRLKWPDPQDATKDTDLLGFSSRLGRKLLKKRIVVNNPVTRTWQGVLYQGFRLKWKTVWERDRTSKEADLLWLVWHRAVAVNQWRSRIHNAIDIPCPLCPRRPDESVLHQFWECISARRAWQWAVHIMNSLITGRDARGPWQMLTWKQGIFLDSIPRKFDRVKRIWMELRTTVLWAL